MEVLGYITTAFLLLAGAWMLWRNRRVMRRSTGLANVSISDSGGRRLRGYVGVGLLGHALVIGASLFSSRGCLHERPLGVTTGAGTTVAQGQIATNLQKLLEQQKVQQQKQERRQITRDSLLQVLREKRAEVIEDEQQQMQRAVDSVGIPTALTKGSTAAGSPFGTRAGGELWLYRVRHAGPGWDANPKALPVLLQEVGRAFPNLKVSSKQEVITLDELPKHRGKFFPTLLFFTGTGGVDANEAQRRNLREYLEAGGLIVADSSGGDFEEQFKRFMRHVYGRGRLRSIEFDHEVFRGEKVLYQLTHGCPIYRSHGKQDDAEGVFDPEGRLVAFISPGDLGSAWASVALGRSRTSVERAFQMGTNLVSWSMNTVRDRRDEEGKPK